jgi:hypothetical protein
VLLSLDALEIVGAGQRPAIVVPVAGLAPEIDETQIDQKLLELRGLARLAQHVVIMYLATVVSDISMPSLSNSP